MYTHHPIFEAVFGQPLAFFYVFSAFVFKRFGHLSKNSYLCARLLKINTTRYGKDENFESYYGFVFPIPDALIHPFYVNGFFFVSGYLLFWKQLSSPRIDEKSKQFLNNSGGGKTLTLNILFRIELPSVLFAMIEFFPKKIIKGEAVGLKPFLLETLGGCTYWFTSALAVAELLFLLLLLLCLSLLLLLIILLFLLLMHF